jgi:hypothetical protein
MFKIFFWHEFSPTPNVENIPTSLHHCSMNSTQSPRIQAREPPISQVIIKSYQPHHLLRNVHLLPFDD